MDEGSVTSAGSHTGNSSVVTSPTASRPTSGFGTLAPGDSINGNHGDDDDDEHALNRTADRNGVWRPVSRRFRNREKEITSPYPYLDVASDLIAQLAVSN